MQLIIRDLIYRSPLDCIACIIIQATVKIGSIYLEKSDVVLFINVSEGYEKKTAKTDKRGQKRRA